MHTELEELGPPEQPAWSVDPDGIATRAVAVGGADLVLQVPKAYERRHLFLALDAAILAAPPSEPISDLDAWQLDAEARLLWREVSKLDVRAFLPASAGQEVRDQADAIFEYAEGLVVIRSAVTEVRIKELAP